MISISQQLQMEEQINSQSDKVKVIRKIGNGSQGEVFQIQQLQTQSHYALKIIKTKKQIRSKERQRIQFQIQSNLYLSNNVLTNYFPKLYKYWFDAQSINILFELCDENSQIGYKKLSNYSQRYNYLIVLLFDGLQALSVLQQLNIIHRDIKPQNILRKEDGFKMGDFGLSRVYAKGSTQTNNVGNKLGRSPEFSTGLYTTKSDIWSLGIHIFYLLENTLPFDEKSLMMILNNPNQMDKVISSKQLQINLQPAGRKSKNVLSFLHMILSEMIVLNPDHRLAASTLLGQHYTENLVNDISRLVRFCLFGYLKQRHACSEYYLIILCAYIDYYRLEAKIKEDPQSNKRKICLMVKRSIFQLLIYVRKHMNIDNPTLQSLFESLIVLWQTELGNQFGCERIQQFKNIQNALEIYKISKVQQKFPLIQWMVRLYRVNNLIIQGAKCKKIALWDIPIDFYKLL